MSKAMTRLYKPILQSLNLTYPQYVVMLYCESMKRYRGDVNLNKLSGVIIAMGAIVVYMVVKNNLTPKNLGVNNGKLSKMPNKPNAVSSQTDVKDKQFEAMEFKENLESSKEHIIKAIETYGNAKIIKNEKNYIYAVFTTGKMKYYDDVEYMWNDI